MTRNTDTPRLEALDTLLSLTTPDHANAAVNPIELLFPGGSMDYCEIIVAVRPDDFSSSKIAHAVEDCNVHLVNMNLTGVRTPASELVVALRTSGANPMPVVHSLERYGFRVMTYSGTRNNSSDDESRRRAAELLHILEI